ncbi:hypothetical protein PPYR_11728 [Photinus pyralis]|uniref:Scavenger receptor class B member 1 n=1 Tax=Photinus pyralis TaxID=7054 RepID=A0A5N4AC69_PHOPY|nr:protein peste-like [Photinus pyralis]XP_031352046.1 protein peste-like [Photinus pyralis]XP_031352047.1 protein peste-like [Photinus pyralis]KAB0794889.1 hypothetical protein PPYR_11728 [Photinus pyralis]
MPRQKMQIPITRWNICFICAGAVLTILGVAFLSCTSAIYDFIISSTLKLEPNSTLYKGWQKPDGAIRFDIYLFNWTNPHEIGDPNIKPKFEEVGPYRYIHFKEKTDIVWNTDNETITYKYLKYFYFDEENSPRHVSDVITTINMVPLTTAHITDDWHLAVQLFVSTPVKRSPVFVQKTVKEILFDGYEDPVLSVLNAVPFVSDTEATKFGWFIGRNGSVGTDGVYNMRTTAGDEFATLKNWNYANHTSFFEGRCGKIYGSGGEMFPRNLKPTHIDVFSAEMCRTGRFNFAKKTAVKGIPGYKFTVGDEVFDNGTKLKENVCYDNSLPSGILNVSSCKDHSPVFLSLPHFYYADPFYVDAVEGLHPEKDKHELYMILEPNTGLILDLAARMQINVQLHPLDGFGNFANLPHLIFPVLWFEQQVTVADELVANLKLLFQLPKILEIISLVIIVVGILCIIGMIIYIMCFKMRNKKEEKRPKEEIPLNSKS